MAALPSFLFFFHKHRKAFIVDHLKICQHAGVIFQLVNYYSNELQVQEDTPPTFLVHADNDSGVPVENSLLMYQALRKNKISAELHILSEGEHGFGLGGQNNHISAWTSDLKLWLNWLNQKKN